jgi:hypothetical protein
LSSSRDLISLKRGPHRGIPDKQLNYLDLTCPANFPEARSGREGMLPGYRDYVRIADQPEITPFVDIRAFTGTDSDAVT